MTKPPYSLSLQHMLEAVDELVDLLELEKTLLLEARPVPDEVIERLRIASEGVSEVVTKMRESDPPDPSPELKALKAHLQERFVYVFKLTRETEQLIKAAPAPDNAPASHASKARLTLSEVEKQYRARMRLSSE